MATIPSAPLAATRSGNVLTATANGAITAGGGIDAVTPLFVNDRVLVKDQATGADNGIYTITSLGSGGTPYVLTRAADFDTSGDVVSGLFVFIQEGITEQNRDTGWFLSSSTRQPWCSSSSQVSD